MADAPNVGAPPSGGSYGEAADLLRLKQQLPPGAIGNPSPGAPPTPLPPMSARPMVKPDQAVGRPPTGAAAPPGLPSVLLQQPAQAAGPPQQAPPGSQVSPDQARLFLLQNLANAPQVSAATRAWAQEVLQILQGGQGRTLTPPGAPVGPPPAPQGAAPVARPPV